MPYLPDFNDFAQFDLRENAVYYCAPIDAPMLVEVIRRPMTYSTARQRQEFVAFDEDDQVFHIPADMLASCPDPAAGDLIFDMHGRRHVVQVAEIQTDDQRWHIVAREIADPDLALYFPFEETDDEMTPQAVNHAGGPNGDLNALTFVADSQLARIGRGLRLTTANQGVTLDA